MQRNWRQKVKIKLFVHKQHVKSWSSKKEDQLHQFILSEFHSCKADLGVTIKVLTREEISVEFTVVSYDASLSAMKVAKALEREFFGLKIYKRETSFEKK